MTLADEDRVERALTAFDEAAADVVRGRHSFAVTHLADALIALALSGGRRNRISDERRVRWEVTLEWLAVHKVEHRALLHAEPLLRVLIAWHARLGNREGQRRAAALLCQGLTAESERSEPILATLHLDRAVRIASENALKDIHAELKLRLFEAVTASEASMTTHTTSMTLPPAVVAHARDTVVEARSASEAVHGLAMTAWLVCLPRQSIESQAKASLARAGFRSMVSGHAVHDGKIVFGADTAETKLEREVGMYRGFVLAQSEATLSLSLHYLFSMMHEGALFESVSEWRFLRGERRPLLQTASSRFFASDWLSAGTILCTVYEALLRDAVRSTGYAAMSVVDGTGSDETLSVLLHRKPVRDLLGGAHADFVEYLLCSPKHGPNLRNVVAHGTATPADLSPTRVLLVWMLIVRLAVLSELASANREARTG